jgi:D-beta-D-heptose 7-phosphate kinase/D-beta-D-heptose 1-phosphate adenosyltransferase
MKKVWINGCFDILHYGHFKLIEYAKSLGDQLVIGIDSDKRVKESKGDDRPFHTEGQRVFNLMQIEGVDIVVVFDSDTQLKEQIKRYNPDYFVIGSEYINKSIIGKEFVKEIKYFEKVDGFSTTEILKIKK